MCFWGAGGIQCLSYILQVICMAGFEVLVCVCVVVFCRFLLLFVVFLFGVFLRPFKTAFTLRNKK